MHRLCLVLLKPDDPDSKISELLERYGEFSPQDAYIYRCTCATKEIQAHVDAAIGTFEENKSKFVSATSLERLPDTESDAGYNEWTYEVDARNARSSLSAADLQRFADADCDKCNGKGIAIYSWNPSAEWDWWAYGGRYTGIVDPDYDPRKDPENLRPCTECKTETLNADCRQCQGTGATIVWPYEGRDAGNKCAVSALRSSLHCRIYVTDEGMYKASWHEDPQHQLTLNNDWLRQESSVRSLYADHVAHVIDLHACSVFLLPEPL